MQVKVLLNEDEIPRQWYNLAVDLPTPMQPPLGPDGNPITPDMLAPVFPMNLIEQEVSSERWIDIPEEVKNESISPPGSHKPNTAVAQAWYNKKFGITKLTTETGAGQWGSALAFACSLLGLECKVFMVRISFDQKPYRKAMMQT
jgi:tryptophan synthase beta chain